MPKPAATDAGKSRQPRSKRRQPGATPAKSARSKAAPSIGEIARRHTIESIEALLAVLRDGSAPATVRVSAANALLDRGWGKAGALAEIDEEGGAIMTLHRIEMVPVEPRRAG